MMIVDCNTMVVMVVYHYNVSEQIIYRANHVFSTSMGRVYCYYRSDYN